MMLIVLIQGIVELLQGLKNIFSKEISILKETQNSLFFSEKKEHEELLVYRQVVERVVVKDDRVRILEPLSSRSVRNDDTS